MPDASNLYSTPEGYASPQQIASVRDYAKVLLSGSGMQPVHHWTQGVSNMVNALVGGNSMYQAQQQENRSNDIAGRRGNIPFAAPPTGGVPHGPDGTSSPFGKGPASEGQTNSGDDIGRSSKAISGIESGGDYNSIGPKTKTGDRAYGKYQVMGANIPEWTQAALGTPMRPDDFLANPEAQEAVFKHKFGEYTAKYGPEGAAKAWFAGEHGMNNPNAKDQLGTSVSSYGQQFSNAFNGPDATNQNPAVQAMGAALRGQQVAANTKRPNGPLPQPNGAQPPLIDPRLAPRVPPISSGQMQSILSDPRIPEERKVMLQQLYLSQGQSVGVPVAGGRVLVDPLNPGTQQYIPDLQKGDTKYPGGYERPTPYTVKPGPNGTITTTPAGQGVAPATGPRSEAAPAPTGGATPTAAPGPSIAQNASAASAAPPQAPVQVASLDPAAGIAAPAGKEPVPPAQPATAAAGKTEVAENASTPLSPPINPMARAIRTKPPGDIPQQDWDIIQGFGANERQNQLDLEAGKKGVDASMKKYDTFSTQANNALKLLPNIAIAQELMKDPNFDSGITANISLAYNKVKAALPQLFGKDAPYAAAPQEVFGKVVAQSILDNMRTSLAGLGQVRIAEIDLLKQATASLHNTPAANRALLELSRRALTQLDNLNSLAQQYQSGDEVVGPDGKVLLKANVNRAGEPEPRRGLDVGFDKLARQYVLDHPTTTPEEAKDYMKLFKTSEPPATNQGQTAQPKVGEEKQFKQGIGVWDGKQWAPKGQ